MKINYLIISFLSILILSCNSDDSGDVAPPIPVEQRYLSKITDENDETILTIEYNEDNKIKKFNAIEVNYRYEYDPNGRVDRVFFTSNGSSYEIVYSYNQDGIIVGFSFENEYNPVVYNEAENSYTFRLFNQDDELLKVYLNTNNDCTKLVLNAQDPEESININFLYEQNYLGSLHNGSELNLTNFIGPYPMFLTQMSFNALKIPLDEYLSFFISGTYENEYDSEMFLKNTTLTTTTPDPENGGSNSTIKKLTYHYIQL